MQHCTAPPAALIAAQHGARYVLLTVMCVRLIACLCARAVWFAVHVHAYVLHGSLLTRMLVSFIFCCSRACLCASWFGWLCACVCASWFAAHAHACELQILLLMPMLVWTI